MSDQIDKCGLASPVLEKGGLASPVLDPVLAAFITQTVRKVIMEERLGNSETINRTERRPRKKFGPKCCPTSNDIMDGIEIQPRINHYNQNTTNSYHSNIDKPSVMIIETEKDSGKEKCKYKDQKKDNEKTGPKNTRNTILKSYLDLVEPKSKNTNGTPINVEKHEIPNRIKPTEIIRPETYYESRPPHPAYPPPIYTANSNEMPALISDSEEEDNGSPPAISSRDGKQRDEYRNSQLTELFNFIDNISVGINPAEQYKATSNTDDKPDPDSLAFVSRIPNTNFMEEYNKFNKYLFTVAKATPSIKKIIDEYIVIQLTIRYNRLYGTDITIDSENITTRVVRAISKELSLSHYLAALEEIIKCIGPNEILYFKFPYQYPAPSLSQFLFPSQ